MKRMLIGMLLAALTALAGGCGAGSDNAVIAKVNSARITAGDLKKQLADLPPDTLNLIATDAAARKSVLDDLIAFELVLQEARRQGLDNMDFNKRQDAMRKEMERRIQEEGRNELVTTLLQKELGDKLKVAEPTAAEVKEFYEKNKDKLVTAGGRKVSLQEAAPQIKTRLFSMKQRDVYMGYASKLRDKAKVAVHEDALQAIAATLAKSQKQNDLFMQLPSPEPKKGAEQEKSPK